MKTTLPDMTVGGGDRDSVDDDKDKYLEVDVDSYPVHSYVSHM